MFLVPMITRRSPLLSFFLLYGNIDAVVASIREREKKVTKSQVNSVQKSVTLIVEVMVTHAGLMKANRQDTKLFPSH